MTTPESKRPLHVAKAESRGSAGRRNKRRVRIATFFAIGLIVGWAAWRSGRERVRVTTGGDELDIRFLGVVLGGGKNIYDERGRIVGELDRFERIMGEPERAGDLKRTFVFELPDTEEPIFFSIFTRPGIQSIGQRMGVDGEWIYPGASYPFVLAYVSNHPYRAAEGWIRRRSDGRWLLFFDAVLLESHVRNKRLLPKPFPVFRREVSLEALDMRLTYAIAAPESAPLRFEGPFELSRPVAGAPGSAMRLAAIDPPDKERSLDGAVFEVYGAGQVGLGFAHSPDAFAIDDRGGVHRLAVDFFAGQVDARTSPGLPATHYIAPGVGRGRIRRIVAGGAWRRKTFHNLPTFVFPNKEQRRDAEARDYLEAFGRIFGEEKTPTPQTNAMILLSTREEAIELAAIARSAHIPLLVERLAGFSLEDLRPAQRRTLIDALLRWTDSGDPLARLHGLKLGAQLKAPEIFEPALQWIFEPVWNEADWMDAGLRLAEKRAREATRPISRREFQAFESQFGNPAFGSRRWNPAYWRLRARWEAPILLEEAFPQFTPEQVGLIKGAIEKTNDSLTEERLKLMLERRGR